MRYIELENFRCYKELKVPFSPGINLLVGDNTSGKTSLLRACKYVMSTFFAGYSAENTKWSSPTSEDFTRSITNGIIDEESPIKIWFDGNTPTKYLQGDDLKAAQEISQSRFLLQKNSSKNSRPLVSGLAEYKSYTKHLLLRKDLPLPLFAYFSTEDIHATRKIEGSPFTQPSQKRSFGYYECLDGNGFYRYWEKRLLSLKESGANEEFEIVRNALISALGPEGCDIIRDINVLIIQKTVVYKLQDGREIPTELLSDGYKRIINIVLDLAFRCALLNRNIFGLEAVAHTEGTVVIDEIDMHLHPSLQANILKALKATFKEVQFIVTSHAPMVMSNIKSSDEDCVLRLSYTGEQGYKIQAITPFGLDMSTITKDILGLTPREKKTADILNTLFDLIHEDKTVEAKKMLNGLKSSELSNLPELTQAEIMLSFNVED